MSGGHFGLWDGLALGANALAAGLGFLMPEAGSLETEGIAAMEGAASSAAERAGISEAEKTAQLTAEKMAEKQAAASAAVNPGKVAEKELGEAVPQGTFDDYGHRVAPSRKSVSKSGELYRPGNDPKFDPDQDIRFNAQSSEQMKALESSGENTASHSDMGLQSDPLHHHHHLKGDVMSRDINLPEPPGGFVAATPVGEPPVCFRS